MNATIGRIQLELEREAEYNTPYRNERTIEVPLGRWFLGRHPNAVELGAVMPYYLTSPSHTIIDLHDPHPLAVKKDIVHLSPDDVRGKPVLSISTLEHIGRDYSAEYSHEDAVSALEMILSLSPSYLVSIPIGYNRGLDVHIAHLPGRVIVKRLDADNRWGMANPSDGPISFQYDSPFPYANALFIVTNEEELLA